MNCTNCGSEKIIIKVPMVDPLWGTPVGPKYKKGKSKIMYTAPTYIDFCEDCGTILRTYIDVPHNAKWLHGESAFSPE